LLLGLACSSSRDASLSRPTLSACPPHSPICILSTRLFFQHNLNNYLPVRDVAVCACRKGRVRKPENKCRSEGTIGLKVLSLRQGVAVGALCWLRSCGQASVGAGVDAGVGAGVGLSVGCGVVGVSVGAGVGRPNLHRIYKQFAQ
jgi:hypothetical protein